MFITYNSVTHGDVSTRTQLDFGSQWSKASTLAIMPERNKIERFTCCHVVFTSTGYRGH